MKGYQSAKNILRTELLRLLSYCSEFQSYKHCVLNVRLGNVNLKLNNKTNFGHGLAC